MLQVKRINIKQNSFASYSIYIDFIGQDWRDFHLAQDILRQYVSNQFCVECTFGYTAELREYSVFKYPKDKLITLIAQSRQDPVSGHTFVEYDATWTSTKDEIDQEENK